MCAYHTDHFDGATTSFIIGNAGAGKSFAIKQIALNLLDKPTPKTIIPILLPISSWQEENDLYSWVAATTAQWYLQGAYLEYVDDLIRMQSDQYEIVYLLDGLDEIQNELIEDFFQKMKKTLGVKHLVVGTRREVFYMFKEKLLLHDYQCYELQQLDASKIRDILRDNVYADRQEKILATPLVYEKFNTPLLLAVLSKVVNNEPNLTYDESLEQTVWKKFTSIKYEEYAKNGSEKLSYSLAKLQNYAGWLARRENEFFSLDDLQPSVLQGRALQWTYALITRLLIGIIISMGIGFTMSGPMDFILAGMLGGLMSVIAFVLPIERWIYPDGNTKKINVEIGFKIFTVSTVYLVFSLLVFGIYFSISGQRRDMIGAIAPADWTIGILFAIMFTVLGAIRDFRYGFNNDIQLIQKRNIFRLDALDVPMALVFALVFSLIVGLICAGLMVLFADHFPQNIFTGWIMEISKDWQMNIFSMGFMMVLPVSALIGLLIGLNNPKYYKFDESNIERETKHALPYYSVSRTIFSSLTFSLLVMVMVAITWGMINLQLFKTGWEGGNKGIQSGLAAGFFIGLWWGWKDIIKIWVLRLILYVKGEAPFSFSLLLKDLEHLAIVIRNGARYNFLHLTLHEYLRSESFELKPSRRISWLLPLLAFGIFAVVGLRIYERDQYYWQHPGDGMHLECRTGSLKPLEKHKVLVLQNGSLCLESKGLVRVGRILGHVTPLGTGTGFFGMPLKSSFNIVPEFKHGVLMCRRSSNLNWFALHKNSQAQFLDTYPPLKTYRDTITVSQNDTLEFALNDTEWQNNAKGFRIALELLPTNDSNKINPSK
ncbi:MAG: hypothetical protein IT270_03500 [Saprospiraceae bacterium]|nr:hypothetical protein [Saprospiraceae bacterium]